MEEYKWYYSYKYKILIRDSKTTRIYYRYILKDLNKKLKTKWNINDMEQIVNSKVNNNEVFDSINNLFENIDNIATDNKLKN